MKVAIVGGDLLGCASAYNLARVYQHDLAKHEKDPSSTSPPTPFDIVLFEKGPRLGGSQFQSINVKDSANEEREVEVGSVITLANTPGSYVQDAISTINGTGGPWWTKLLRRKNRNGDQRLRVLYPWQTGISGEATRSFAVWDWAADEYPLIYRGWTLLDWLERLAGYSVIRTILFFAFWWMLGKALAAEGWYQRVSMLITSLTLLTIFLYSPEKAVKKYHRGAVFWTSTFSQMWAHGISVGIFRGTLLGLQKHIAMMQNKNAATASVMLSILLERTGLKNYVMSTARQFFDRFKFPPKLTELYVKGVVESIYSDNWSNVNSLAALLCLQTANQTDADVGDRIVALAPNNKSLCEALVEFCAESCELKIELSTEVSKITELEEGDHSREGRASARYKLTTLNGAEHFFDCVLLCTEASSLEIIGVMTSNMETLLGPSPTIAEVGSCPYSHIAVVSGILSPVFFKYTHASGVPDVVQVVNCPQVSLVERLFKGRAPTSIADKDQENWFVYRVVCNKFFHSETLNEMFCSDSKILYFNEWKRRRQVPALSEEDQKQNLVLGSRFVHVAAARCVARDAEWDLINATNGASLLSAVIQWKVCDDQQEGS